MPHVINHVLQMTYNDFLWPRHSDVQTSCRLVDMSAVVQHGHVTPLERHLKENNANIVVFLK